MATSGLDLWLDRVRRTRVWKSVFRRGPARTNRTRSLAIFGNFFMHAVPAKVREKSLRVRAIVLFGIDYLLSFCCTDDHRHHADVLLPPRFAGSVL